MELKNQFIKEDRERYERLIKQIDEKIVKLENKEKTSD